MADTSQSASLTRAVEALYEALGRDDAAWVPEFVADDPSAVVIGTDGTEWWEGFAAIRSAWTASKEVYGGTALRSRRLSVRVVGAFGWAVDEPDYLVDGRPAGRFRLTLIFSRHDERWLLLHLHASIAVDNDKLFDANHDTTRETHDADL